jgi:hypothetical protein
MKENSIMIKIYSASVSRLNRQFYVFMEKNIKWKSEVNPQQNTRAISDDMCCLMIANRTLQLYCVAGDPKIINRAKHFFIQGQ